MHILVLKPCHCIGSSLCSLPMPSALGRRAGSKVTMSHAFSWDVLAVAAMLRGGARFGEAEATVLSEVIICSMIRFFFWLNSNHKIIIYNNGNSDEMIMVIYWEVSF